MPGRRCYCHYCNASFPYSREGRRKHNSGSVHVRFRQRHYENFETAQQKYQTQVKKEKCRKFLSSQGCSYGQDCMYSHLSLEQLDVLKLEADEEKMLEEYGKLPSQCSSAVEIPASADDVARLLLKLRRDRVLSTYPDLLGNSQSFQGNTEQISAVSPNRPSSPETDSFSDRLTSNAAENLQSFGPLPPSLQAYSLDDVLTQPIPEWG